MPKPKPKPKPKPSTLRRARQEQIARYRYAGLRREDARRQPGS
jgi:hypothetical protein